MRKLILMLFLLFPTLVWSGDEFQTPELINGSSFECTAPEYRVIGAEKRDNEIIFWVVAKPELVLKQKSVNQIIKDIYKKQKIGSTKLSEIWFYSSVRNQPKSPAFHISDRLAIYSIKENKIYFSVSDKKLYGGWVHGPSSLK